MDLPKIGKLAPDFKIKNHDGVVFDLKKWRGKNVVLYFYPKAMTPGCTTQACGVRDRQKEFDLLNTKVFGISIDGPKKLLKFIEKEKLNFDLLSDPDHEVADLFGVWGLKKFMGKEYMGTKRVTFIIGVDGKLKFIMDPVKSKTHHEDLLEYIKNHLI